MKRLIVGLLLLIFSSHGVMAADLDTALIKLNRQKVSESPLPILVQIKTGRSVVENGLKINLGSGWTVNGAITINNSGLPSGVMAWPGLSVVSASGQEIVLSGNDVDSTSTYGFWITSGISQNPSGINIMEWKWRLTTTTLAGDDATRELSVPVTSNDSLTITGRVGARVTDFQLSVEASPSGTLIQDDEVLVTINYGNYLNTYVTPVVIEGSWTYGTISGNPSPSVELVDYIIGSATNGYGGAVPVVDSVNRKITWTINSIPANTTDLVVSFKLKTNDSYTVDTDVTFDVGAQLRAANVVTVDTSKNLKYHYYRVATPTSGSTSSSSNSEGGSTTGSSSPTPTSTPVSLDFEDINIVGLDQNNLTIEVLTNIDPNNLKIWWGESVTSLGKSLTSLNKSKIDLLGIDELLPGKRYYFKIEITDGNGKKISSDIYTITTPLKDSGVVIDEKSMFVTALDNLMAESKDNPLSQVQVSLPYGQVYSLKVSVENSEKVTEMRMFLRKKNVLGINTVHAIEANTWEGLMTQLGESGSFSGQLMTPRETGFYEVVIRVVDVAGNIKEVKAGELKVFEPIKVVDDDGNSVDGVKVNFWVFNKKLNLYQNLENQYKGINNPSYTDVNGEVIVPLPVGQYKLKFSHLGYKDQEMVINVDMGSSMKLPIIRMERDKINIGNIYGYYASVISDVGLYTFGFVIDLAKSSRWFHIVGMVQVGLGGWLAILIFGHLYKLRLLQMLKIGVNQAKPGRVEDVEGYGVSGAEVFVFDDKKKLLYKTTSDSWGGFDWPIFKTKNLVIKAMKKGFESNLMTDFNQESIVGGVRLVIKKEETTSRITDVLEKELLQLIIWVFVLLGLMWMLLFWKFMGWEKTWPFIILGIMNLILWCYKLIVWEKK